jgi:integrase
VIDPKTGQSAIRPIYTEISSHTARKTFIANLYLKVKDPNLIASMSGHSENSKAFRRYRKIAEEMKQELVEKIN